MWDPPRATPCAWNVHKGRGSQKISMWAPHGENKRRESWAVMGPAMGGLIHGLNESKICGYAKNKGRPLGIAYGEDSHYKGIVN